MTYKLKELSIELTNECGYKCIHCSSGATLYRLPYELQYEDHMRLLCEARALGASELSLSGGSPLLYPQLPELITWADNLGYERIMIYVVPQNHWGTTIDMYKHIDRLIRMPRVAWIFSLHSHNSFVNDYIMQFPGAFKDITYSIDWLVRRGCKTEIHMVPMQPNFMHIPFVRQLCASLGVRQMSVLRFVPQTRGKKNFDALGMDKADFHSMQKLLLAEITQTHSVSLRMGCPIDFRHAIGALKDKARPCHAGDDLMLVRPTGAVHPCAAWKSLPADSNVSMHSLDYIWHNSAVFNAIRDFKDGGYKQLTNGCGKCGFASSCKAGCPAQRLHTYGGDQIAGLYVQRSDPLCPIGDGDLEIPEDIKTQARQLDAKRLHLTTQMQPVEVIEYVS